MTIYGFDTTDRDQATAALLVYAVWRSRDPGRFKITPDVWGQVERFVKASAKRATSIPRFLETLKPRLQCATLQPRAMEVGLRGTITVGTFDGGFLEINSLRADQREFLTQALANCDEARVLDVLYRETAWIVLLVRDRLERERPVEARISRAVTSVPDDEETEA